MVEVVKESINWVRVVVGISDRDIQSGFIDIDTVSDVIPFQYLFAGKVRSPFGGPRDTHKHLVSQDAMLGGGGGDSSNSIGQIRLPHVTGPRWVVAGNVGTGAKGTGDA